MVPKSCLRKKFTTIITRFASEYYYYGNYIIIIIMEIVDEIERFSHLTVEPIQMHLPFKCFLSLFSITIEYERFVENIDFV